MQSTLKKILLSSVPRSFLAIVAGYTCWYTLNSYHTITIPFTVPLCFYNTRNNQHVEAPESITIYLRSKRMHLAKLDTTQLAVHINACSLTYSRNPIAITQQNLFLPESIKLLHYIPSCITATLTDKDIA